FWVRLHPCTFVFQKVMKQVSLIVTILFFLVGCSSVTHPNPHVSTTPYSDTSNPAARYTSLTIDTTTLSRFIKNEVHDPNDARRIRAVYAGRNFQFAWFDEQGLTEQGEAYWNLHQM